MLACVHQTPRSTKIGTSSLGVVGFRVYQFINPEFRLSNVNLELIRETLLIKGTPPKKFMSLLEGEPSLICTHLQTNPNPKLALHR